MTAPRDERRGGGRAHQLADALNALGSELRSLDNAWSVLRSVNSKLWIANKRLEEVARVDPLTGL